MRNVNDWINDKDELYKRIETLIKKAKISSSWWYACKECKKLSREAKGEVYPFLLGSRNCLYCYKHKILSNEQIVDINAKVFRNLDDF